MKKFLSIMLFLCFLFGINSAALCSENQNLASSSGSKHLALKFGAGYCAAITALYAYSFLWATKGSSGEARGNGVVFVFTSTFYALGLLAGVPLFGTMALAEELAYRK